MSSSRIQGTLVLLIEMLHSVGTVPVIVQQSNEVEIELFQEAFCITSQLSPQLVYKKRVECNLLKINVDHGNLLKY
jgi:hypothetical protein